MRILLSCKLADKLEGWRYEPNTSARITIVFPRSFFMEHKHTNALIHEKSPYLLQHAHNPVNWNAWNDETFARAKHEDKPIFLSIGYATCHWCHVMERESFENEETAAFLNEHYIAVKVDREERPDIDAIYMAFCQALTGHGGWPLSVFMTPAQKPFFVGTYFPPQNHSNRPGFPHILDQIQHAWVNEREKLEESSESITGQITNRTASSEARELPADITARAFERYEQTFDPHYGGFNSQPKFPSPQNLMLLLRYHKRTGNAAALTMVEQTIRSMRQGGVYDHIGYGFHRYSTDRFWLVPHFEKMLYDQAMMAIACLETFQVTHNDVYSRIAEEIFTYVLRDMTAPNGGFYSAEDADSEGHEGKFYVWTHTEILATLGGEDGALFCAAYNIREDGNFADEATSAQTGENIPHLRTPLSEVAAAQGIDTDELRMRLSIMRTHLFDVRENRIHPLKDDKVLADWNGLMIAAFAIGGKVLENAVYLQAAERSWEFISRQMTHEGRFLHRWREGEAAIPAFLDDYAFLAWGVFELYQATFNLTYLKASLHLCEEMLRLFKNNANEGGLALAAQDNETLIMTTKEAYDGAIPSGNSVAAMVLARVGRLTSNQTYLDAAQGIVTHFASSLQSYPTGFAQMLIADDFLRGGTQEIIIAGKSQMPETTAMMRLVATTFLPHAVVALNAAPNEIAPFIEQAHYQIAHNGVTTAYICENFVCQQPLMSVEALQQALAVTLTISTLFT